MAEIFNEENSIVLEAARKMVSLGSEAAQLSILGKQTKIQDEKINKIIKLLTVYRKKDSLSDDDLESILYDLRGLTDIDIFPTISPLVGQELVYLVEGDTASGLIIQNNSSNLASRSYLNFYTLLQAVDDGTHINVGLIPGPDGYIIKMNGTTAEWMPDSGGHDIYTGVGGAALTTRSNLRFQNGLTASDFAPDTLVKLGGALIDATTVIDLGTTTNTLQIAGSGASIFDVSIEGNVTILGTDVASLYSNTNVDIDGLTVINLGASDVPQINIGNSINTTNITISGQVGDFPGIVYADDYSAQFVANSLITKSYADTTYAPLAGGPYWELASGGTLTGVNTITSNTANQLNFTGTWTASANNQFMAQFGGTLTATTTVSDILNGYVFNPSITGGATNAQTIRGVTIQPTLTGGADNGDFTAALYVNPTFSGTFGAKFGILSSASLSTVYAGLRVQNSSTGSARLEILAENSSGINAITSMFSIERLNGTNSNVNIANTGTGNIVLTANAATYTLKSGATSISQESYGLLLNTQGIISIAATSMQMYYSSATSGLINVASSSAGVYASTGALAASHKPVFLTIPGDYIAIAANTELIANEFRNPTSWTWNDGTVATQRFNYFKGFTVNKTTTAATFTNIYTMYVDASTAGAGVTLTNNWAAGFAGNIKVGTSSVGKLELIGSSRVEINSGSNTQMQFLQGGSTRFIIGGASGPYLFNGYNAPGLPVMTITQVASTSGSTPGLVYTGAAHTAQTTGTEIIDWNLNFNRTITFAGSTGYATQRTMFIQGATYAFASPTGTITNAYTLYIDPPVQGTNATITNSWALGVKGNVRFGDAATATNVALFSSSGAQWITFDNTRQIYLDSYGGNNRITPDGSLGITFQNNRTTILQNALSSSWQKAFTITPGAHTAMTANTEFISNDFAGANWTWADGTVATQRFNYFRGFTVNKTTTAATFTNIYTMYVDASTAGTGVTFTNNWAAGFNGNVSITVASSGKLNLSTGLQAITNNSNGINTDAALYISRATSSQDILIGYAGVTQNVYINSGGMLLLGSNAQNARFYFVQPAQTSAWVPTLRVDPGAHTSLTANTEFNSSVFSGASWTWADGTVATQRFNYFKSFTALKTTTALTITNGYTLYAENITPGTGVTITNNYAIGSAGNMRVFNSADLIIDVSVSNYVTVKGNLSNDVELVAGAGNGANPGKSLYLTSGAGGLSGAQNAGNINIATGVPNGAGTEGSVNIQTRSGAKIGFFNVTAVVQQAGLTAITHTSPGTPDYAIQDLSAGGFGFATKDEGNTVLSVIKAMHDAMKNYGLLT